MRQAAIGLDRTGRATILMTREADLVASSGVNNAIQGKSCAETRIARASLEAIRQKLTLTRAGSWLNCSQRGYQRPTSRCGGDTNRTHKHSRFPPSRPAAAVGATDNSSRVRFPPSGQRRGMQPRSFRIGVLFTVVTFQGIPHDLSGERPLLLHLLMRHSLS